MGVVVSSSTNQKKNKQEDESTENDTTFKLLSAEQQDEIRAAEIAFKTSTWDEEIIHLCKLYNVFVRLLGNDNPKTEHTRTLLVQCIKDEGCNVFERVVCFGRNVSVLTKKQHGVSDTIGPLVDGLKHACDPQKTHSNETVFMKLIETALSPHRLTWTIGMSALVVVMCYLYHKNKRDVFIDREEKNQWFGHVLEKLLLQPCFWAHPWQYTNPPYSMIKQTFHVPFALVNSWLQWEKEKTSDQNLVRSQHLQHNAIAMRPSDFQSDVQERTSFQCSVIHLVRKQMISCFRNVANLEGDELMDIRPFLDACLQVHAKLVASGVQTRDVCTMKLTLENDIGIIFCHAHLFEKALPFLRMVYDENVAHYDLDATCKDQTTFKRKVMKAMNRFAQALINTNIWYHVQLGKAVGNEHMMLLSHPGTGNLYEARLKRMEALEDHSNWLACSSVVENEQVVDEQHLCHHHQNNNNNEDVLDKILDPRLVELQENKNLENNVVGVVGAVKEEEEGKDIVKEIAIN